MRFSEIELLPQLPQPRVVVTESPFWIDPPAVIEQGALTMRREMVISSPALMMLP